MNTLYFCCMLFFLFLAELILLYFLSRWLIQVLYGFFLMLFRVRSVATSTVIALLFPGTVLHELSHLFTAEILGVRTGKLVLAPESIKDKDVRTGSVSISQTDPFRRSLIGLAPIGAGMLSLVAISNFLPQLEVQFQKAIANGTPFSTYPLYAFACLFYLLFAISNSMFSSPQDLKGCLPLTIVLVIIMGAIYFAGFRFFLTGQILDFSNRILDSLTHGLGIVLSVNVILLMSIKVFSVLIGRMTRTRIVRK